MSTNYYLKLHIGKTYAGPDRSTGWIWDESTFPARDLLHVLETGGAEVVDEYGRSIDPGDMIREIYSFVRAEASDRPFS